MRYTKAIDLIDITDDGLRFGAGPFDLQDVTNFLPIVEEPEFVEEPPTEPFIVSGAGGFSPRSVPPSPGDIEIKPNLIDQKRGASAPRTITLRRYDL